MVCTYKYWRFIFYFPGALTFKLSRPEATTNKVLSEATIDGNMPLQQWNCIAFNVKEMMNKRKIYIQVSDILLIPYEGILFELL